MTATVFESRPVRGPVRDGLRERLRAAHTSEPFSSADPRATVRRAAAIVGGLGLETTVYRGGVDLRGSEVDHVWLGVRAPDADREFVLDAAFPLFSPTFVEVLRRFVAGDASAEELEEEAAPSDVSQRVIGVFPVAVRYLGRPVWTAARRGDGD